MWKPVVLGVVGVGVFVALQLAPWTRPAEPEMLTVSLVPDEVAKSALDREVEVAKALGFVEATRDEEQGETWYHSLELNDAECLAVVASNAGHGQLGSLSISDEHGQVARDTGLKSVMHVQGCFEKGGEYSLRAELAWASQLPDHTVRVVVLRAPSAVIGGNEKLNRGMVPLAP